MNLLLALGFWRLFLFVIALITANNFLFTPAYPYSDIYLIPSGLPQWIWGWANFDGVHYLTIAQRGYFAQFTQVFFPLYPIILKFVGVIINDKYLIISGLILSFISFFFLVICLKNLLNLDYDSGKVKIIIFFLLIFPTSFYFASLYTESVFFLFVLASFYFARKKKWWLSGLCGMFASATRITGVFLLPALIWEWKLDKFRLVNWNEQFKSNKKIFQRSIKIISIVMRSPILYLIPLGLISYMIYLQLTFGDALYFWHAQPVFGAQRTGGQFIFPLQVVWRYFKILTSISIKNYQFWTAFWELSSFFFALFVLVIAHIKKVRLSYLIFSWLVILIPSLTGTFSSLPRYMLTAFPIFIVIGSIHNKRILYLISIFFIVLLIIFTSNFIRGRWVA